MAPMIPIILAILAKFETTIVEKLLRSPGFHNGVRKIHRTVEDMRYGRDPNEPLRPGEATEEPNKESFFGHFVDELRNQIRGTPTDHPPPGPPKK